jgi:hypothetical protein
MGSFLALHWVADTPKIFFEDESHPDVNRQRVRREQGGLWQRAGYESCMTDDEWESLEGEESKRLENEYQRLIKAGEVQDIDLVPERPRWIPVTERLPERDWDGFSAIVVVAAGNRPRCGPYLLGRYYKCEPGDECHECDADIGERWYIDTTMPVTHWMPLPAPPAD